MSKASELIAHLETGGLLVKGNPDRMQFLRLEGKTLRVFGFGSALGQAGDRLESLIESPEEWLMTADGETRTEIETKAVEVIEKAGHWVDHQWHWNEGRSV
jgi:hypothetical protein